MNPADSTMIRSKNNRETRCASSNCESCADAVVLRDIRDIQIIGNEGHSTH